MSTASERPILFSGEMVRAILSGAKTQMRRVVKPQPPEGARIHGPEYYSPTIVGRDGEDRPGQDIFGIYDADGEYGVQCPWEVGMRLWVRETWGIRAAENRHGFEVHDVLRGEYDIVRRDIKHSFQYRVDREDCDMLWRKPIFMPRVASRITLEITAVRVERLQAISEEDAIAEGCLPDMEQMQYTNGEWSRSLRETTPREEFEKLWKKLHGNWNPELWVWVLEFKHVDHGH